MSSKTLTRRFGWLAERAGATLPEDVRAHLHDLAKGSGRAYFGPRTPKPGAIGYQESWQLTANVASHELSDRAGFWAVTVRANWRIVFRFEDGHVLDVDYLDYH